MQFTLKNKIARSARGSTVPHCIKALMERQQRVEVWISPHSHLLQSLSTKSLWKIPNKTDSPGWPDKSFPLDRKGKRWWNDCQTWYHDSNLSFWWARPSVSLWRWSLQEMLAHLKIYSYKNDSNLMSYFLSNIIARVKLRLIQVLTKCLKSNFPTRSEIQTWLNSIWKSDQYLSSIHHI